MSLQTDIDDFLVLNPEASDYEVWFHVTNMEITKIVKSNTPAVKVDIATVDLMNDTLDRLDAYVAPEGMSPQDAATAENIARKIFKSVSRLDNPDFYFNFNVPQIRALFDHALYLNVLSQGEYDGVLAAVTVIEKPHANVSLNQVKSIRRPPIKRLCSHYGIDPSSENAQTWVISTSNRDVFLFEVDAVDNVDQLKLSLRWKESAEATNWITHQVPAISVEAGLGSRILQKPIGLSKARLMEWSFTEEYAGQINSVAVSLG